MFPKTKLGLWNLLVPMGSVPLWMLSVAAHNAWNSFLKVLFSWNSCVIRFLGNCLIVALSKDSNSCPCLKFCKIISRKSNFIVVFSERVLTHCSEMFVVSTRPCRLQFILTRNVFWSDNFLQLLGLIFCKTVLKTITFIVGKIENPAAQNLFIHFPLII